MLSRKHYRVIARCIKDSTNTINNKTHINKASLINDLCAEFKADNGLFSRERFINACE